jgi:hypothetical protein
LLGGDSLNEQTRLLRLHWSPASAVWQPLAVQDNTVTEWAALGVAFAVVAVYANLRVQSVALEGDRFDYWVTDGESDFGLEVSGTMTEDVIARHREKVRQLRENPYGQDGYVVVVGFATRMVIFSFRHFEEGHR